MLKFKNKLHTKKLESVMEERGHHSFHETSGNSSPSLGTDRCKSLYDDWDCPAYFPYHSYKKNKAKSVSKSLSHIFLSVHNPLHSEWPKLCGVLVILSAIGLT